ncbi:MAG: DEAD/DEAH box helicase [Thermoplasmata archaeon]
MDNKVIEQNIKIQKLLVHAWLPFFGKFGKVLESQIETIPRVLAGSNIVLVSPTASGKTEAIVAPVAELLKKNYTDSLLALYLVPTRALVNDVYHRICEALKEMGFHCVLKHGDKPYIPQKKAPNFLITTPESLDSLICRHPSLFQELKCVILDEIHLIDNTYRGDQIRVLLWRLMKLAKTPFSIHLLSATLSFPQEVGARYVDQFEVIMYRKPRKINLYCINEIEKMKKLAVEKKWKKILCFCNSRREVEAFSEKIRGIWAPYPVYTHHSSLSKKEREETENGMRIDSMAICVATSSLEIGIDIGDIDLIAFNEIPYTLDSFLQRIGRGNRRKDYTDVLAITKTEEEEKILRSMVAAAVSGHIPVEEYTPHLSVAIQQIFSYLFQHCKTGVQIDVLYELLLVLCTKDIGKLIIDHLVKLEWIEIKNNSVFATERLMNLCENGKVHSNIQDSMIYRVIDISSGKEIGQVSLLPNEIFVLAGKCWQVIRIKDNTILVKRCTDRGQLPVFRCHRALGAFHYLLPSELK